MVVLFENSKGQFRQIASVKDEKEGYAVISSFLKEHNFKSYYTRVIKLEDGCKKLDVGSYTEFFYFVDENKLGDYLKNGCK